MLPAGSSKRSLVKTSTLGSIATCILLLSEEWGQDSALRSCSKLARLLAWSFSIRSPSVLMVTGSIFWLSEAAPVSGVSEHSTGEVCTDWDWFPAENFPRC